MPHSFLWMHLFSSSFEYSQHFLGTSASCLPYTSILLPHYSDAPLAKNEAADAYVGHMLLPHSIGVYRGLQLQLVVTWRTLFLKTEWSHGPGGAPEAFKPQEVTGK